MHALICDSWSGNVFTGQVCPRSDITFSLLPTQGLWRSSGVGIFRSLVYKGENKGGGRLVRTALYATYIHESIKRALVSPPCIQGTYIGTDKGSVPLVYNGPCKSPLYTRDISR